MKINLNMNKWKKIIESKKNVLIFILVGILLIIISLPDKKSTNQNDEIETESNKDDNDYNKKMESKLEKILEKIDGVGDVSVMLTMKSSEETVIEKDITESQSESEQNGTIQKQQDHNENSVFEEMADGTQKPYVTKTYSPEIDGVIVVAEGGEDSVVIRNITEAVKALFGVETHKIKVMKRK